MNPLQARGARPEQALHTALQKLQAQARQRWHTGFIGHTQTMQRAQRLGLGLGAALAVYVGLGLPWLQQWHDAQHQGRQLREEYAQVQQQIQRLEPVHLQHQQWHQQRMQWMQRWPSHHDIPALLQQVAALGERHQLQFDVFKPGATQAQPHSLHTPIHVTVHGSFHGLGHWMADVAQLPQWLSFKDVAVKRQAASQGLRLKATLVLRTPPEAANSESAQ